MAVWVVVLVACMCHRQVFPALWRRPKLYNAQPDVPANALPGQQSLSAPNGTLVDEWVRREAIRGRGLQSVLHSAHGNQCRTPLYLNNIPISHCLSVNQRRVCWVLIGGSGAFWTAKAGARGPQDTRKGICARCEGRSCAVNMPVKCAKLVAVWHYKLVNVACSPHARSVPVLQSSTASGKRAIVLRTNGLARHPWSQWWRASPPGASGATFPK